jgi:uncharacterized membrane protein
MQFVGCVLFMVAVVAIIALIVALRASSQASAALAQAAELRRRLERLERTARAVGERTVPEETRAPEPPPSPSTAPAAAGPTKPVAEPSPLIVTLPSAPLPQPAAAFAPAAPLSPPPEDLGPQPEPERGGTAPPSPTFRPPITPPPPPKPFDWESLIGVKLFSWIAGIALVLAALFFLSYSVEHGWLSPPVRASMGMITGIALLLVCELRVARDYSFTANAMDGAGIAILYATLFAMHALWHLLPASAVFALMLIVTAIAVLLSIRRDSVFIALLGLVGGFATPALLSSGENKPIALFSYLLLLNVGLLFVAIQRRWPLLTALSVTFTVIYEWGWIGKFLTVSQLPLAVAIFILFAAAAGASLWLRRRDDGAQRSFDFAAISASGLPLLFAIYVAAVSSYGVQFNVLFTFLLFISTGLSVIAIFRGPSWLHLLGGATIALVLVVWRASSYTPTAWPSILLWIAVFVVVQLALSHFMLPKTVIAPLFLLLFPTLALMDVPASQPLLLFGTLFVLVAVIAGYAILHEAGMAYAIAALIAIVTEGVWSADHLAPNVLTTALLIYAAFALLLLAVPMVARRMGKRLVSQRTMLFLLLGSIAVLFFMTGKEVAFHSLWPLAMVLLIINVGAIAEGKPAGQWILAAASVALSWIVFTVWSINALNATSLAGALIVIGGFAVLAVGGGAWIGGADEEDATTAYLGLAGHLFLFVIAAQPSLSVPPWPLFTALFIIDLAVGFAAIFLRRARLMAAAMAASQVVLMIWAVEAKSAPWPLVAFGAALGICAMALIWFRVDRRFTTAAIIALFAGDLVVTIAGFVSSTPLFAPLLVSHVVIGLAILAVAWLTEWHDVVVFAVILLGVATGMSRAGTFGQQLGFAGAIYALFIAYPILLGARAKRFVQPYLAAVLAGIPFFFMARMAIREAGHASVIGLLPVGQAALMLLLVWRLLRVEPEGERLLSRLALTAAAALAFISVAIPLQLEKQWITIGWAVEAAALVWLFRRVPHRGLLVWSAALFGAVFVRLALNPAVLSYHPASHAAIVNWYLYTYAVSAAAFFVAVRLLPDGEARSYPLAKPIGSSGGTILLFLLVNIEIADFYAKGPTLTFNFFSSSLAEDLTYTIVWAVFAVALLVSGLALQSRGARIAAIVLLLLTVLKCFLHDLARLGGLYRVGSLLGLTVSLLLVGVLLQKFVIRKTIAPAEETT